MQMPNTTAEQQARDILERMGIDDAQYLPASDLTEIANLIADLARARAALAAEPQGDSRLPEEAPLDHPPSALDRRETAAWYHGHACGWQLARSVLASSEAQP